MLGNLITTCTFAVSDVQPNVLGIFLVVNTRVPKQARGGDVTETQKLVLIVEARRLLRSGEARCRFHAADVRDAEIARTLELSRSAVSRHLRGERTPRGEVALAYGRLLAKIAD
jgi:hypothetical protein